MVADEPSSSVKQAAGAMRLAEAKRPLLALGVLVLVGLGVSVASYYNERAAEQRAEQRRQQAGLAWANLRSCLLGGALEPGETIAERTRRIALAAGRTRNAEGDWPSRCSGFAEALFRATDDRGPSARLHSQLRRRFGCEPCLSNAPADQLPGLTELVASAGLVPGVPTATAPNMSGRMIGKAGLPTLTIPRANLEQQQLLDDGSVRLLFSLSRSARQLCTIAPDRAATVVCGSTQATSLDGASEGFVLERDSDSAASYRLVERAGGVERRAEAFERTGGMSRPFLLADHVAWFGERVGKPDALFARPIGKKGESLLGDERAVADRGGIKGRPRLCRSGSDWVALFGKPKSMAMVFASASGKWAGPVRLAAGKATPRAATKPAKPVGSTKALSGGPPSRQSADRTDAARRKALREAREFGMIGLLGGDAGSSQGAPSTPWGHNPLGEKPSQLWGRSNSGPARRARRRRRESRRRARSRPRRPKLVRRPLSCRGEVGTLSWREPGGNADRIVQWRCTPKACAQRAVRLSGLDVQAWWIAASLYGDSGRETMLLVWRSTSGEVRMRLAPFDELQQARDIPLLDSKKYGGPDTHELQAFVGQSAVVLMFRGIGYHALRIDAGGKLSLLSSQSLGKGSSGQPLPITAQSINPQSSKPPLR